MTTIPRTRRNESEWAAIMAKYEASGLPARTFCEQSKLTMKSFTRWRRRLLAEPNFVAVTSGETEEAPEMPVVEPRGWDVEFELGHGMTLRIRRSS